MNKKYLNAKKSIEEAFLSLLTDNDVEKITITDICKYANINRSTFYTHYESIDILLKKMEEEKATDLAHLYDKGSTVTLKEHIINTFRYFKNNQKFYKIFLDKFYSTKYLDIVLSRNTTEEFLYLINNKFNYNKKEIEYSLAFFKAGLTEMIKLWIDNDCVESPEKMHDILKEQYSRSDILLQR